MTHDARHTSRSPSRRRAALGGGALAAVLAASSAVALLPHGGSPVASLDLAPVAAIRSFSSCDDLLGYYRSHASALVGPYGLPGVGGPNYEMQMGAPVRMGADTAAAPVPAAAGSSGSTSGKGSTSGTGSTSAGGTNVQVAGVDEADLAKRVGDLLYVANDSVLRIWRTAPGSRPVQLAALALPGWTAQQLLVDGETALLVGTAPQTGVIAPADGTAVRKGPTAMPMRWQQSVRLAQVDISDPSAPRLVRSLDLDGTLAGARLTDGVVRIGLDHSPAALPFVYPGTADDAATKLAADSNRAVVTRSGIDAWLPSYTLTSYRTGSAPAAPVTGRLLDCSTVSRPDTFAGLDTLGLLTFDLRAAAGIGRWDGAGVVASGTTMYATATHTYLATAAWHNWAAMSPDAQEQARTTDRTQIHLFDTAGRGEPRYVASGQVQGFLLNQFAMDEDAGVLRVASTDRPAWWGGWGGGIAVDGPAAGGPAIAVPDVAVSSDAVTKPAPAVVPTQSRVTVLRQSGASLAQVGVVSGLGKGEQIRAVRFVGQVGYVVTFRQTDPLFTVDLRDPTHPRVTGELKMPGYSAYLHPVGDGLLLGIGQDGTAQGQTLGLALSLFDVSDPTAPKLLDKVALPGMWTDVEGDHHAFTFADGLALVPFSGSQAIAPEIATEVAPVPDPSSGSGGAPYPQPLFDAGVVAVRVQGRSLTKPVVLRPVANGPVRIDSFGKVAPVTPQRTFVGSGDIWTLTDGGVAVHDASSLRRIAFTRNS